MIKKTILLALIAAILLACLAGCNDPVKKVKKDLQEAKEDLNKLRNIGSELQDRNECLDTALSDGEASAACPGAGD